MVEFPYGGGCPFAPGREQGAGCSGVSYEGKDKDG